jgi:RNA polymerase sigma factor (sigma-70 family)
MATSQVSEVIQYLRRTVLLPDRAAMTDGQLLSRFLEGRDEDAFAALVQRHGPMVWGVCRRLLPNHQDAEDAFQATFLVLVRKAATVRPRDMVANWLYGVADMTAHRGKVAAAKARRRERQFVNMPEPAVAEPDLCTDLRPLLDQELTRLPDLYRVVVVLCDLEGKTRKETARQLGLPEGTVASRLARARAMLAKRLARHGLAVSGLALAAVLSKQAASACVPPSVVASTIKAASLLAAGQTAVGIISVKVAALTEGVVKTMFLTKLKIATAVLLVAVAAAGSGGLLYRTQAAQAGAPPATLLTVAEQNAQAQKKPKGDQESLKRAVEEAERDVDAAEARLNYAQERLRRLKQIYEAAKTPNAKGAGDTPKKDTAKSEKEKIQGAWRLVRVEVNGVEVTPFLPPPQGFRATFTGDKWTNDFMEGKGFTFKLDPASKPKNIDLHPLEDADKTLFGIYQLQDDDLTICFCQRGKQERPSAFENYWRAGSHTVLVVLKRQAGKVDQPPKDEEEVRRLLDELLPNEKVRQLFAERQKEADREKAMREFFDEIRKNPALLDEVLKAHSEKDQKELRRLLDAASAALDQGRNMERKDAKSLPE